MSENTARLQAKKIYLKDASFESPGSPNIFLQSSMQPDIDMNINVDFSAIDEESGFYDVVLQVTTTATENDATMFVAEIKQAGVFEINVDEDAHRDLILNVACPNMLLPFAREELANIVTKGGFPQLLMQPINFEAMYRQRIEQDKQEQQAEAETTKH